jgi:uncharacterized membrane protein
MTISAFGINKGLNLVLQNSARVMKWTLLLLLIENKSFNLKMAHYEAVW